MDLAEAKNYVGAFHQPSAVIADTRTLQSLPAPELAAGYAEVVKTALIAGGDLWAQVRTGADPTDPQLIAACALTKLRIVAQDERDSGLRQVLNLGHTVGHAIETATGYAAYRHGEAVALGLLAALRLSEQEACSEVAELLKARGLPTKLNQADPDAVVMATARDKKRRGSGEVPFVLLDGPGRPAPGMRGAVQEASRGGPRAVRLNRDRDAQPQWKSCTASTSTSSAGAIPTHYGGVTLDELERGISETARELGLEVRFFQTNHEGAFVEHLHGLDGLADAIVLNPGAWTHYSWAIRDALELTHLPAVEVHLSDVDAREEWRRHSVITRPVREPHLRQGARRLPRRARAPARGDRRVSAARRSADRAAGRRGVDLAAGDGSHQRALPDRLHGHQRPRVDRPPTPASSSLTSATSSRRPSRSTRRSTAGAHRRTCSRRSGRRSPEATCAWASTRPTSASRARPPGRAGRPSGSSWSACGAWSRDCGRSRTPGEVAAIRAAAALADAAFEHLVAGGLVGRTERELAVELEFDMRRRGAERPSFEPIVAAGAHGALPHAVAARRRRCAAATWS